MKRVIMLLVVSVMCIHLFARKDSIHETRIYDCRKVNTSPGIDGVLDEEAWQKADWQGEFTQHMPYSGRKPSFDTEFAICYDADSDEYSVLENSGIVDSYSFSNPDFNVKEFLSNLVIRWEYQPGSVVYLVWSQSRDQYDNYGTFRFTHDLADMVKTKPTNVFMIKFSYRIGR